MSTKLSALTAVSGALNPASLILVNDADEGTASARSKSATIRQVVSPLRVSTVAALRALSVANYQTGDLVTVLGYYSAGDGGGGNFTFNSSSSTTDDNGTVLAPNSGSGRWLRVFNGDTVELDWFGCVGDGVTDDRVNVQRALDWAAARTRATVNIGNRTYALGNYLTLNSNYTAFIGRGQNYSRFLLTSATLALKSLLKIFRFFFVITCSFLGQVNNLNRCLKFGVHYRQNY